MLQEQHLLLAALEISSFQLQRPLPSLVCVPHSHALCVIQAAPSLCLDLWPGRYVSSPSRGIKVPQDKLSQAVSKPTALTVPFPQWLGGETGPVLDSWLQLRDP